MPEQFSKKKIIRIRAYKSIQSGEECGNVSFSWLPGFEVQNSGMFEMVFRNGSIFFTKDGVTDVLPDTEGLTEIKADPFIPAV